MIEAMYFSWSDALITVWHKIVAGSNFCEFFSTIRKNPAGEIIPTNPTCTMYNLVDAMYLKRLFKWDDHEIALDTLQV